MTIENRDRAAAIEGAAEIVTAFVAQGGLAAEQAEEWAFRFSRALFLGAWAGHNKAAVKTFEHYREHFLK